MRGGRSDTDPEAERVLFAGYARMTPAEKLRRVADLNRAVETLALAGIRARHPGITDREARLRLAAKTIDRDTMIAAFGWDPAEHAD